MSGLRERTERVLAVPAIVILTAYLIHKGSAESKDGDEAMQAALQRIEQRLDRIESAAGVRQGERPFTQVAQTGGGQDTPPTEQLVYRSDWPQRDSVQADGAGERSHTR